jgi:phosphatidylserine/phosphatidylglycerophosphate/cardiolipin synthase-like enzyme
MPSDTDSLVQLVITAPEPYGAALAHRMRCRMTLGVLTQLLAQAKRYVVIAAPFMQAGYGLSGGALADALKAALQRGVNVDIVGTGKGLQTLDLVSLQQNAQGNLRLFQPKENITDEARLGSHAKFCIADNEKAYVGSANLTGPGLSKHLEMGLLVQGEVARQIEDFWRYCLEIELFVPVKSVIS